MARNRRTQAAAIRFGPAIKAFLLCLLIGGSGVGYVWQKGQVEELAAQIKKSEQELGELKAQNVRLRKQLALMHLPRFLEAKIKELNLGLVPAAPSQKWVLPEPLPEPENGKVAGEKQYAADDQLMLSN